MIQEYLLLDTKEKRQIQSYRPNGIESKLFSVQSGKCWYVRFSIKGDSEKSAKKLSNIDKYVQDHFHVQILQSGCSAYFYRRLYPVVSKFEHELRKLLYVKSKLSPNENNVNNIENLESKTFGDLFYLLFIDNNFIKKIKEGVNNTKKEIFSKKEIISFVQAVDEHTLWDSLLEENIVPTLRKRFNDVRIFRNDIMHFHYISWERYKEIYRLFMRINKELSEALSQIEGTESVVPEKSDFNKILAAALQLQVYAQEIAKPFQEMMNSLYKNEDYLKFLQTISVLNNIVTSNPQIQNYFALINQSSNIQSPQSHSPQKIFTDTK
ncbi:MAG: hypothetical protein J6Z82_07525 [Schwartzia sp.]|nr:hypothetical protein [Schwartzia sp. (in: firmicutes)]